MSYSRIPLDPLPAPAPDWDSLRRQARSLEQQIDSRLIQLSQSLQIQPHTSPTTTQQELSALLRELESVTVLMEQVKGREREGNWLHLLQRHQANLVEYKREFAKTRGALAQVQARVDLLGTTTGTYSRVGASLQGQQQRMESSHDAVDEILQYVLAIYFNPCWRALDSQRDLERQQGDLRSYQNRLKRVLGRFPLIRSVINNINTKKGRESLFLGLLIAFFSLILLYMIFR